MNYRKDIKIELDPDEVADMLICASDEELALVMLGLARYFYNQPEEATSQMISVKNEFFGMSHDIRNIIRLLIYKFTHIFKEI